MGALDGIDLAERAELLGISCRALVALAQSDRRIFAVPSLDTTGSVTRLKRWLRAGSPAPDFTRLEYTGSDDVRTFVVEVLSHVPTPVAWHGVEFVGWLEIGRRCGGRMGLAGNWPVRRMPDGDQPHAITLCGNVDDRFLHGVIAHELGHSWEQSVVASLNIDAPSWSQKETAARLMAAGVPADQLIRQYNAREVRADALAALWGYPIDGNSTSVYATTVAGAKDLASEIASEIDGQRDAACIAAAARTT